MYLVRESGDGYFCDEKINGVIVGSHYVTLKPTKECSCKFFQQSRNYYNHSHILVVEKWVRDGKPPHAMYTKNKQGKITTLFEGIR